MTAPLKIRRNFLPVLMEILTAFRGDVDAAIALSEQYPADTDPTITAALRVIRARQGYTAGLYSRRRKGQAHGRL